MGDPLAESDSTGMKLAILGASARAAAQSAVKAGYNVVAADLFADEDLKACCPATRIESYPQGFEKWLAEQDVDGWLYTGALENNPELVDRMAEIRPLLGNSGEPLRRCRDPLVLEREFTEAGIKFPETRSSAAGLPFDGSWLCKTYRAANSSGVWRLDGEESLKRAENRDAYFQQHAEGATTSVVFAVSDREACLLGFSTQHPTVPTEDDVVEYLGCVGPWCVLNQGMLEQLKRIGNVLLSLKLVGIVGVDMILPQSEEISVIEINPRWTASIELTEAVAIGSFMPYHVAACKGEELPALPKLYIDDPSVKQDCQTYGKAVVYAKREIEISAEFTNWALSSKSLESKYSLADIPAVGTEIPFGQPVTTVLTRGVWLEGYRAMQPSVREVERRLYGET